MEMIQTNSKWHSKTTVKKGDHGEYLVRQWLESKGYIVYQPISPKAHCFDMLVIKDRKEFRIVECKTKPGRNYYPDTGFDLNNYYEYKAIEKTTNVPVFIIFIDEAKGEIYGNLLSILEQKKTIEVNGRIIFYPLVNEKKGLMFFPLQNMKTLLKLGRRDIEIIREQSTRNYPYIN